MTVILPVLANECSGNTEADVVVARFTLAEIEEATAPLRKRIAKLEETLQMTAQGAH